MGELIVGVDDSDGGRQAVVWAGCEAALRGDTLTVVTVVQDATLFGDAGLTGTIRREYEQAAIARAETLLEDLTRRLPQDIPSVHSEVLVGSPAAVLLTRAEGQAGLVVGRRGRGGFAGLLLGSVSQQVAVHATCPVVVVPGGHAPSTDEPSNGAGAVVVGVDGSQHARRALVRAAEEAAVREALLDVVIVSPLPRPPAGIDDITIEAPSDAIWPTSAPGLAGLELSRRIRTAQAHAAAEWQEEVRRDVDHDLRRLDRAPEYKVDIVTGMHPAEALIEAASAADLLVVGSRGYGGFAGMLAGSVSQHCVRHARVPVMVMPQG